MAPLINELPMRLCRIGCSDKAPVDTSHGLPRSVGKLPYTSMHSAKGRYNAHGLQNTQHYPLQWRRHRNFEWRTRKFHLAKRRHRQQQPSPIEYCTHTHNIMKQTLSPHEEEERLFFPSTIEKAYEVSTILQLKKKKKKLLQKYWCLSRNKTWRRNDN